MNELYKLYSKCLHIHQGFARFEEVEELSNTTRNDSGFGSTGL